MTTTARASLVALALLAAPSLGFGQSQAQGGRAPDHPPGQPGQPGPQGQPEPDFARYLYPPELIMQFQQRINLRPEQRTTITTAIQQMQSKVIDLQWQMQAESQKLTELMQAETIKEAEALAQVDRVLSIERDVKRTHLGLLIRIKNTLTREQQTMLDSLKREMMGPRPAMQRPPDAPPTG